MGGSGMGSDLLVAWPGAEIGFMDPVVGASVLHGDELAQLSGDARRAELERLAAELGSDTDPMAIAAAMNLDEVIDPADTRLVLAEALGRFAPVPPSRPSDLAAWPHWW
jgi:acetyl-CoA carboxylase carboxyltransferase component